MGKKGGKKDVDLVVDYHGCTVEEMRHALEHQWSSWRGRRSVRVIHGQGAALRPELERWCRERGISFAAEPNNPGSTKLFPSDRTLPVTKIGTSLQEKGLRLTPEEEAYLRDPEALRRAQEEARKRQAEEERKRREEAAANRAQQQRDEALWRAEVARLDAQDRGRSKKNRGEERGKPAAPVVVPPAVIKHQEGYWRAELVRVADTDHDTLKKEKRTGLDKLAPPMEPKPPQPAPTAATPAAPPRPTRDEAADRALFEAEMARLTEQG